MSQNSVTLSPPNLSPVLLVMAPFPQAPGTLGRQEVDKDGDRRDEYTGHDDVDDIEEGLALDEQVENHPLVARLFGWCRVIQQHLSWPVPDGPLPVLCRQQAGVGPRGGGWADPHGARDPAAAQPVCAQRSTMEGDRQDTAYYTPPTGAGVIILGNQNFVGPLKTFYGLL